MRVHEIDLAALHPLLVRWDALPAPTKRVGLLLHPTRNIPTGSLGEDETLLLEAGFLQEGPPGTRRVSPAARPLLFALQGAVAGHAPEDRGGIDDFTALRAYIHRAFNATQRQALLVDPTGGRFDSAGALTRQVTSVSWIEDLIACEDPEGWERGHLQDASGEGEIWAPCLAPDVFGELVLLVRDLATRQGPVAVSDLLDDVAPRRRPARALALGAALRYLLLVPRVSPDDPKLEVEVLGTLAPRLFCPPSPPPRIRHDAREQGTPAFLVEDMAVILVDAAAGDTRLKAEANQWYARTIERLAEALAPLPPLVENLVCLDEEGRLDQARTALLQLGFLDVETLAPDHRRFRPTPGGAAWLATLPSSQLERVARLYRPPPERNDADGNMETDAPISHPRRWRLFAGNLSLRGMGRKSLDEGRLAPRLQEALARLPSEGMVDLDAYLGHEATAKNPLEARGPSGLPGPGYLQGGPSREAREAFWREVLLATITRRLLPLGGVALGPPQGEGESPTIALTPVGRYVAGLVDEIGDEGEATEEGRILVQPNFDIVFLTPAPALEASLAPLAERRGHRVGTLFHLSREAVIRAAAAGLDAGEALARLRRAQDGPLPENVARALRDWFGRIRHVETAKTVLLRCPDEETALRCLAVGRDAVRPVGRTTVEVEDPRALKRLEKRLRAEGILLDVNSAFGPPPGRS